MKRRLLIAGVVLSGCVALLVVSLTSRRFADRLRQHLEQVVVDRYGLALSITQLEVGLLPPSLRVQGIRVADPASSPDDAPLLQLHSGSIKLRPWLAADGRLVVSDLELDGLVAHLAVSRKALAARSSTPEGKPSTLPIVLRRLSIWNARVALQLDSDHFEVRNANLVFDTDRKGHALAIRVEDGTVAWQGQQRRIELLVRAILVGEHLLQPTHINLETALLHVPGATFEAKGRIGLAEPTTSDLELEGTGPLRIIREYVRSLPSIDGDLDAKVHLHGALHEPAARIEVSVSQLVYQGRAYGDVLLDGAYARAQVNVEAFRLQHATAGAVTGSGRLDLRTPMSVSVVARLHDARLEEVLALCDVPGSWVTLGVDGDVRAEGQLDPLALNLDVKLRLPDFATLSGSYADLGSEPILAFDSTTLAGHASLVADGITLDDVVIQRADTALTVSGLLAFTHAKGFDLRATSESFSLADPGPIAGLFLSGRGPLAVTLEGPYDDPTISGTLDTDELAVAGWSVGNIKAILVYQGSSLEFDRVSTHFGDGTLTAGGELTFAPEGGPQLDATFELSNVAAPEILTRLGVHRRTARRISAALTGSGTVSGPLAAPVGVAEFSAPNVSVDGGDFGPVAVSWGFGGEQERLWGEVNLEPPLNNGRAQAQFAWRQDDQINLEAHLTDISLELLRPVFDDFDMSGMATGEIELDGPPASLVGHVDLKVNHASVAGLKLGQIWLHAAADKGQYAIAGSLLDGDAPLEAHLETRSGHWWHTARVTLPGIEIGRLWNAPADLTLNLSGALASQGDLLRPHSIVAQATADAAELLWNRLRLTADQPWRARFGHDFIEVEQLAMQAEGLRLALHGLLRSGAPAVLEAQINGDLGSMTAFVPALAFVHGPFEAQILARGSLAAPQFEGAVTIRDATARLTDGGATLDKLNTKLVISGRSLTVESGTARLGTGSVTLSGGATWPVDEAPQLALRADLEAAELQPAAQTRVKATGDLHLSGGWDDMLLKGRLRVDSLRYTTSLELEKLLIRHRAPLGVPSLGPSRALALRVGLQAPNNIILTSNVLEAEFKADLLLTGTTDRPGLMGNLTPLWARARYRDHDFTVERASIDFTEEFRVYPQFQIQARTDGCGMQIGVNISGNADQYTVTPSGRDDNGDVDPQDVLACLQFGLRLEDFSGHDGAGFDRVSWGGLDALWTVSGMDEKVRRLLPIKVDAFRLTSSWSVAHRKTTPHVMLTKEVGEKLELKYLGSLTELNDLSFSLDYRLNDGATLQGSWANLTDVPLGDLGVDLRLRWEFR